MEDDACFQREHVQRVFRPDYLAASRRRVGAMHILVLNGSLCLVCSPGSGITNTETHVLEAESEKGASHGDRCRRGFILQLSEALVREHELRMCQELALSATIPLALRKQQGLHSRGRMQWI